MKQHPDTKAGKMDPIEKDFTEMFVNMGKTYGMNDVAMKIVSLAYLREEDISMEEISKKTGYSLATISNNCKMLFNIGMLKKIKKPGTKRIFISMEQDLVTLNMRKLEFALDYMVKPMKLQAKNIVDRYKTKITNDKKLKKELDHVKDYAKQVDEMQEIMQKWKKDLENRRR